MGAPDGNNDEFWKIVIRGGFLATAGALINALLSAEKRIIEKVKVLLAGIIAGTLWAYLARNIAISQLYREGWGIVIAAFISTIWPILGKATKKYFSKKTTQDDVLPPDDNKPTG